MKVEIEGLKDIEAALDALGDPRAIRAAIRKALRDAGKPMLERARQLAPVDEGNLRKSVKMATAKKDMLEQNETGVVIGIDSNVEPARNVPRKRTSRIGKGSTYRDPGVAGVAVIKEFGTATDGATPFMRPAFDAEAAATIRRFGAAAGPAIEHQAARLAKKRGA